MNIDKFTPDQRRAIDSTAKDILCVAGPGSGKTTVLAARINRLCQDNPPDQIVALTYTNDAARNLESRLAHKVHVNGDESMPPIAVNPRLGYSGTLHGYCLRMLTRHCGGYGYGARTGIIDNEAAEQLIAAHAATIGCKDPVKKILEVKAAGRPKGPNFTSAELVVLAYREELADSGLLDFDLILTEFLRLLTTQQDVRNAIEAESEFLFVDEVQDCSEVDWKIFHALPIANKFFVGDPDQAIFGFRGGQPLLMVIFARMKGVETIYLQENFRCAVPICQAAQHLIQRNVRRIPKETLSAFAADDGGRVVPFGATQNEGDEIAQVNGFIANARLEPDSYAILARTNAIADAFRADLIGRGIQVTEPPKSNLPPDWFMARAIIEMMAQPLSDTLAFFYCIAKATHSGANAFKARQIAEDIRRNARAIGHPINKHAPGMAKPTILDVPQALDRDKVSLEARMQIGEIIKRLPHGSTMTDLALEVAAIEKPIAPEKLTGVDVMTIHSAKGREWDIVFIVGFEDEVTPGSAKNADIEEERRLAFVALTRAREAVYISHAESRRANWGPRPVQKHRASRFLKEITA